MGKNIYAFSYYNYGIDAQTVGEELENIQFRNGEITSQIVVDEARPEDAVLHEIFEWNDEVAAEEYRKHQAGALIRNVRVVAIKKEDTDEINEVPSVRAFVNVKNNKYTDYEDAESKVSKNIYIPIETAMSDEEYRQQVFSEALGELRSFRQKYSNLNEFNKLFKIIDEFDE